jgi:uncharacterized membrane protein (UPF0127 family)
MLQSRSHVKILFPSQSFLQVSKGSRLGACTILMNRHTDRESREEPPMRRQLIRNIFSHLRSPRTETSSKQPDENDVAILRQADPECDIVRVWNATKGTLVAERVVWATGAAKRRGLLGCDRLEAGEGMFLVPCQWIHMFGMRFPIDVAFLARDRRVLAVHHGLCPNRLSKLVLRADGVLELAAGVLQNSHTTPGDRIEFQDA